MKTSIIAALIALIAAPAIAQQIGQWVQSDLNGDGTAERFYLFDSGNGTANLLIENTGFGDVYANNIAWKGGIGQEPELSLAPNGSVRLTSMNESIGRNRWHLTLTIAYRKNTYMVAGYTYSWYDTLKLEDNGICDVNLLNGKGFLDVNEVRQRVRTSQRALPVTQWRDDMTLPDACGF